MHRNVFLWVTFAILVIFQNTVHASSVKKKLDPKKHQWNLSVAAIFQDEAPYLKEWIEFHRLVGVEHFYLYNHLSTDNYLEVLKPYIITKEVELIDWPFPVSSIASWDHIQITAYRDAWKRSIHKTKWLAIIDTDEFLVPVQDKDMHTLLARYENTPLIGGVYGYWVTFGTSFVEKIPDDKLMIETLLLNGGGTHDHFKSIVQPHKVSTIATPHHAIYINRFHHTPVPRELLQVNHYWSRDEWYLYNKKIPRREAWGTSKETCLLWVTTQNHPCVQGEAILRFIPQLRTLMGLSK